MLEPQLTDARNLRLLTEGDADELHALIETNRVHLVPWMAWAERQTAEDTLSFIRSTRRQLSSNNGFQLALLDRQRIAGVAGFHAVDWPNRSASVGYWLAKAQEGQGRMTEAVRTLIDYAFGAWELNRVEIRADVANLRSRAIPERLGFREEGILEQAALIGGRFVDHVLYAMLAKDWPTASERTPAMPGARR